MPRVTKDVARRMIYFAKSLKLKANYFNPNSKSAFEFGRQMASPKLAKINPNFAFSFEETNSDDPPTLSAEFADGSKWETVTSDFSATQLREKFFDKASDCEDKVDIVIPGEDDEGGGVGKKGDKGAKKK